jgi:hypothetical protein
MYSHGASDIEQGTPKLPSLVLGAVPPIFVQFGCTLCSFPEALQPMRALRIGRYFVAVYALAKDIQPMAMGGDLDQLSLKSNTPR